MVRATIENQRRTQLQLSRLLRISTKSDENRQTGLRSRGMTQVVRYAASATNSLRPGHKHITCISLLTRAIAGSVHVLAVGQIADVVDVAEQGRRQGCPRGVRIRCRDLRVVVHVAAL